MPATDHCSGAEGRTLKLCPMAWDRYRGDPEGHAGPEGRLQRAGLRVERGMTWYIVRSHLHKHASWFVYDKPGETDI